MIELLAPFIPGPACHAGATVGAVAAFIQDRNHFVAAITGDAAPKSLSPIDHPPVPTDLLFH